MQEWLLLYTDFQNFLYKFTGGEWSIANFKVDGDFS